MKKRKFLKKLGAGVILSIMLSLPIVSLAASDYYSSLSFDSTLKGATRSFSGGYNVVMEMNASSYRSSGSSAPASSYFSAALYRYHTILSDDYLGTVSYKRDGYSLYYWIGVGSGSYYFKFSKAIDGWTVKSNNVHMYSQGQLE